MIYSVSNLSQAQFERFSYILSNGYRFSFAMPAGMFIYKAKRK